MTTEQEVMQSPTEHEASRFEVVVSYNGVSKQFQVRQEEPIQHLLKQALERFGPIPAPHTMALFDANGRELPDGQTLHAAGVKPRDHLLLRPSTVKGGRGGK